MNTHEISARSAIANNRAQNSGGGIHNTGDLTISDSIVSGNQVWYYKGGGIANTGTVVLRGTSAVSNNTAEVSGGGIYNESPGAVTTEPPASVSGNTPDDCFGCWSTQRKHPDGWEHLWPWAITDRRSRATPVRPTVSVASTGSLASPSR